jgi:hypothetical protein
MFVIRQLAPVLALAACAAEPAPVPATGPVDVTVDVGDDPPALAMTRVASAAADAIKRTQAARPEGAPVTLTVRQTRTDRLGNQAVADAYWVRFAAADVAAMKPDNLSAARVLDVVSEWRPADVDGAALAQRGCRDMGVTFCEKAAVPAS